VSRPCSRPPLHRLIPSLSAPGRRPLNWVFHPFPTTTPTSAVDRGQVTDAPISPAPSARRPLHVAIPAPWRPHNLSLPVRHEVWLRLVDACRYEPVETACCGAAAEAVVRSRPAVLFVDIGLPSESGYAVARRRTRLGASGIFPTRKQWPR